MQFSYVNPTQIHFGQGQVAKLAETVATSHKVLFVYGGGSIKKNGIYQQVTQALADHEVIEFSGVEPNPTQENLDKAVQIAKQQQVDFILAVGGGSVIDGCKYIAAAALYEGNGWDILTGAYEVTQALPIGAVLTLPATGSESNTGSVITQAASQCKLSFRAPAVQPKFAILDPDVVKTLPEKQLANGIVDAWVHVCEQYLTYPTDAMVQEGYAEVLLKTLRRLGDQFHQRDNDMWRENLMWAANQSLNGLIGSGVRQDWATHLIGHELTALWHVDHARSLAIIQPSLLRNQIENKRQKLEQMGQNVFGMSPSEDLAERTIAAIEAFYKQLDMPIQFDQYQGSKDSAIDSVIDKLTQNQMVALGERQSITLENSRSILQEALVEPQ